MTISPLADYFKSLLVIETATILAGPSVGMFLAELGATVIKVENLRTQGDTTRRWKLPTETTESDVSAYFSAVNWGKRSIGLDLAQPAHQQILHDLLSRADIFLHNFRAFALQKFKLDEARLRALNERLICAQVTAYGEDDPRPGFDAILQAETGFTAINGLPDGEPTKMPVALIDVLLAHQMKEALLLALLERNLTGRGQTVSLSLFQAGLSSLVNQATNYLVGQTVPQRRGSDHPNISPYGTIFRTKDQQEIVLAVGTEIQFQKLTEILDCVALLGDSRFQSNSARVAHNAELKAILAERIAQFERDALLNRLHTAQIPAGAVRAIDADLFAQPQAQALLLQAETSAGQPLMGVRSVAFPTSAVNPAEGLSAPPHFDQDRDYVLRELLQYSDEQVAK
ncbi:CoA transferase [Anaerolineales bacterium HSG25]|nr:CoA transferase [Anaerolineales bacterium HSG25]